MLLLIRKFLSPESSKDHQCLCKLDTSTLRTWSSFPWRFHLQAPSRTGQREQDSYTLPFPRTQPVWPFSS